MKVENATPDLPDSTYGKPNPKRWLAGHLPGLNPLTRPAQASAENLDANSEDGDVEVARSQSGSCLSTCSPHMLPAEDEDLEAFFQSHLCETFWSSDQVKEVNLTRLEREHD